MGQEKRTADTWISNANKTYQSMCNAHRDKNIDAAWPKGWSYWRLRTKAQRRSAHYVLAALQNVLISELSCVFFLELV